MARMTLTLPQVDDYADAHTTPLPPLLEELVATTQERWPGLTSMLSGHVQGAFLQTLVRVAGARRVLEIGMFTGFSALMMAEALPDDGTLITCEVNPEAIAVAESFFERSRHGGKIQVRRGPALETLGTLEGPFDLVFIDADKENYINYYEAALPLLAPRGLIAVDNVLWYGGVLAPETEADRAVVAFNEHVTRDSRVRNVLVPARDGLMLVTRLQP